jgi:hypothetical protein
MFSLVGIALILVAVGLLIFWLATGRRSKPLVKFACVFLATIGFLLVVKDKLVEVTLKDVLTIKTSASEATADAKSIASIKANVENQRATIDLVATEAERTKILSEDASNKLASAELKLAALDVGIKKGNESLKQMDAAIAFSLIIAKAQNDNAAAFGDLIQISASTNSPFASAATGLVNTILHEVETEVILESESVGIHWELYNINPDKATLPELISFYSAHPDSVLIRFNVVQQIFNSERFSERDRFDFVSKVIQTDNSLKMVQLCCNLMTPKSKLRFNLLRASAYVSWWGENRDSFTNAVATVP